MVGAATVSAKLEFRISGQGKNFFGDGLALWLNDWATFKQVMQISLTRYLNSLFFASGQHAAVKIITVGFLHFYEGPTSWWQ
jgi:hypothetical protein